MQKYHFSSIAEHNKALGLPAPEHPLISVVHISTFNQEGTISCKEVGDRVISTDFYSISIKRIISGEIVYGRTRYDFSNGTMIFTAPEQEISTNGVKVKSEGRVLIFHQDYIRGHPIQEQIRKYHFFGYAVHEALHLSPKEEKQVTDLFDAIETEYHNNQDEFTKELILDLVTALLRYSNRYYHRQFLMRKESQNSLYEQFKRELETLLDQNPAIPSVEEIAGKLHVTSRYLRVEEEQNLPDSPDDAASSTGSDVGTGNFATAATLSDALKVETGKTAKEWIHIELINSAKNLLLASDKTVAEIAYQLGFEYPNYFTRLFKNKAGITPTEYRKAAH